MDKVLKPCGSEGPCRQTISHIVGSSGGGKTTLCSLIPRFYDVDRGSGSCIDGTDIRKVQLKNLRDQIGIVQQDVYLFAENVMENIRYGRPDATDEEVIEAAKRANAHEFIMELPDGYETDIGQRGVKLSGGQKQRLSIARVFLKNPPVLIFDEATSAPRQREREDRPGIPGKTGEKPHDVCDRPSSFHDPQRGANPCPD